MKKDLRQVGHRAKTCEEGDKRPDELPVGKGSETAGTANCRGAEVDSHTTVQTAVLTTTPTADVDDGQANLPRYRNWREQPPIRSFISQLAGWRVLYTKTGNTLLLLSKDGPMHYLDVSPAKLVSGVIDAYFFNLKVLRMEYFRWIGHRLVPPIPAGKTGDVLVAFKTRRPRATNDGVMSYIAGGQIAEIIPQGRYKSTLVLKSGYRVETLWSAHKCVDQIRQGGALFAALMHEHAMLGESNVQSLCDPEPFLHLVAAHRSFKWH